MTALAVFDLDYTLTRKGTWGRFVNQSLRARPVSLPVSLPGLWLKAGVTEYKYRRGELPRIAVKREMMRRSITGTPREVLSELAAEFVAQDMDAGLDERVVTALRDHQARGDTVLIASAAVCILVERYAQALGVDGFVSTELGWNEGRVCHDFATENCYGPEKLERVLAWLAQRSIEPTQVTAYSDSMADSPLLEWSDKAIVVRPKKKAKAYADAKGFEIWA